MWDKNAQYTGEWISYIYCVLNYFEKNPTTLLSGSQNETLCPSDSLNIPKIYLKRHNNTLYHSGVQK